MSESGLSFCAWCDEPDRVDAFAAALFALVHQGGTCGLRSEAFYQPGKVWHDTIPIEEAVAAVRATFIPDTHVVAYLVATLSSVRGCSLALGCNGEGYERRSPNGPLRAGSIVRRDLLPPCLEIPLGGGARAVDVEAAVLSIQVQEDIEDLLLRLCAPDARARVTTGACTQLRHWHAPVEMCATYHADAAKVVHDLALSWVHLYDGYKVERAAGLSLSALRARVEAAPCGTRIAVAGSVDRLLKHCHLEFVAEAARTALLVRGEPDSRVRAKKEVEIREREDALILRGELPPRGTRVALAGDAELTREHVLAALATPPATLLEALEASAVPDDEWRAAEPRALELIEEKKQGAPTEEVNVSTGKHTRFIEHHAPYHVRRLPSGGVVLATHPYRTLWPLWADVLFLLGITS